MSEGPTTRAIVLIFRCSNFFKVNRIYLKMFILGEFFLPIMAGYREMGLRW